MLIRQAAARQGRPHFIIGHAGIFLPDLFNSRIGIVASGFLLKITSKQVFSLNDLAGKGFDFSQQRLKKCRFSQAVDAPDRYLLASFKQDIHGAGQRLIIAQHQTFRLDNGSAWRTGFAERKGSSHLFPGFF